MFLFFKKKNFPTPLEFALMSNLAYGGDDSQLHAAFPVFRADWKRVGTAEKNDLDYHAVAYCDEARNVLVVAHRGTQSIKDWMVSNSKIVQGTVPDAYALAKKFSEALRKAYPQHTVIETGHSLGGFYAQLNAGYFQGYAVTFDVPGTRSAMARPECLGSAQAVNALNQEKIISFVSAPNIVNTANAHVGTLFRVYVRHADLNNGLQDLIASSTAQSVLEKVATFIGNWDSRQLLKEVLLAIAKSPMAAEATYAYDIRLHDLNSIIATMDSSNGFPYLLRRVEFWPSSAAYLNARSKRWSLLEYAKDAIAIQPDPDALNWRYECYCDPLVCYDAFVSYDYELFEGVLDLHLERAIKTYESFYRFQRNARLDLFKKSFDQLNDESRRKLDEKTTGLVELDAGELSEWNNVKKAIERDDIQALERIEQKVKPAVFNRILLYQESKTGSSLLHIAVQTKKSSALVQRLIACGCNVHARAHNGATPLHYAVEAQRADLVRCLIDAGADVNDSDNMGNVPLVKAEDPEIFDLLMDNACNFTRRNQAGTPPTWRNKERYIHALDCVFRKIFEKLDRLLKERNSLLSVVPEAMPSAVRQTQRRSLEGGEINKWDEIWRLISKKPFRDAVFFQAIKSVDKEILVRQGECGRNLLYYAVVHNNPVAANQLLFLAPELLHQQDHLGETPLHVAARYKSAKAIYQMLVEHGADINAQSHAGNTPLHLTEDPDFFKCLIFSEHGADLTLRNNEGHSPLWRADSGMFAHCLQYISFFYWQSFQERFELASPPPADHVSRQPLPLDAEMLTEFDRLVKILKGDEVVALTAIASAKDRYRESELKALFAYSDGYGFTLLHHAVWNNKPQVTQKLLLEKADVHARDKKDKTPLHYAAALGKPDLCQILLDAGAEVDARDAGGQTPLRCAREFYGPAVFELLISRGANPTLLCKENDWGTSTLWAMTSNHFAWRIEYILLTSYHFLLHQATKCIQELQAGALQPRIATDATDGAVESVDNPLFAHLRQLYSDHFAAATSRLSSDVAPADLLEFDSAAPAAASRVLPEVDLLTTFGVAAVGDTQASVASQAAVASTVDDDDDDLIKGLLESTPTVAGRIPRPPAGSFDTNSPSLDQRWLSLRDLERKMAHALPQEDSSPRNRSPNRSPRLFSAEQRLAAVQADPALAFNAMAAQTAQRGKPDNEDPFAEFNPFSRRLS